jgi:hypothetical protein
MRLEYVDVLAGADTRAHRRFFRVDAHVVSGAIQDTIGGATFDAPAGAGVTSATGPGGAGYATARGYNGNTTTIGARTSGSFSISLWTFNPNVGSQDAEASGAFQTYFCDDRAGDGTNQLWIANRHTGTVAGHIAINCCSTRVRASDDSKIANNNEWNHWIYTKTRRP